MTALGAVVLWRAYFACRACGLGGYFADRFLGLEGFLTRQATRLICLLGGSHSFAIAERLLTECCGWKVSDERIRQACQAEATRIAGFRAESPAVAAAFADAAGEVEFQTDAAKVNTTGGWRDMKIGIFARRERGEPATPQEWDERYLPPPTTRAAFAAIETIDDFAPRWGEWADRLAACVDVIRTADWVIDLGPEAGEDGGNLVYEGIPAGLRKVKESHTGKYL